MVNNRINIGIDAGDYFPGVLINSGIQRLVAHFIEKASAHYQNKFNLHSYFYQGTGRLFGSIRLPYRLWKNHDQVFLGFSGQTPYLTKFLKIKKILFIHDLGFNQYPQFFQNPAKIIAQTIRSIKIADKIVVFSASVKQELINTYPFLDPDTVKIIPAGIDHLTDIKESNLAISHKYFLYVGVVKPMKNIAGLINIYLQFLNRSVDKNIKLIIIGKKEPPYFLSLTQHKNIIYIDPVSDFDLKTYYRNALAILNNSHVEGFCYPVLEALSLGKMVITNDLPIYHEYAPFFSKLQISQSSLSFIDKMTDAVSQQNKAKDKLPPLPGRFTWRSCIDSIFQLIN